MEILCRGRWLADQHVVFSCELKVALDPRAGMLRPLALVTVGKQHDNAREQLPLVLAGRDELVDHDLRAVSEVTELRLPHHEGFGIITAVPVLESEDARF